MPETKPQRTFDAGVKLIVFHKNSVTLSPYAIKRFEEEAICNQYEQDNCIDKTITCSLVVENFDYGVSDSFKINFIILDENNNQLDSQNVEKLVSSRQEELFLKDFNVQTQEAEEEISCSYSVTKIPVKQNC